MSPESTSTSSRAMRVGRTSAVALGSGAMLVAGSGGLLLATSSTAMANPVLTVSTTGDSGAGSLRQAITDANSTAGADVISFDAGLTGTIALGSDLPIITEAVDIQGVAGVTIDGGWRDGTPGGSMVFHFSGVSGSVTISDVTIVGSNSTITNTFYGSAIVFEASSAAVTIDQVSVTASYAYEGGPIGFDHHTGGSITISNSTISGNKAVHEGGAITIVSDGTAVALVNDVIDGNSNSAGEGGALYLDVANGVTTISGSTITDNETYIEGGAIHLADGDLTIVDSTFSGNHVLNGSGGALYLDGGIVEITGSTFTDNIAHTTASYGNGGAITGSPTSLHISSSTIANNTAAGAGGAIKLGGGILAIDSSTIANNTSARSGGGILLDGAYELIVRNSTISSNTAAINGGGIALVGVVPATIENSTIANNIATNGDGGAISGSDGGLVLIADTITGNHASIVDGVTLSTLNGPASIGTQSIAHVSGELTLTSTIIAGNGSTDIGQVVGASTATVNSDHSIIGTSLLTVTDLGGTQSGVSGASLLLGPLTNNGGPTSTFALLAGSPAIDTGSATLPAFTGSEFDQRGAGFARIVNGLADIGAFEVQAEAPVTPSFTG